MSRITRQDRREIQEIADLAYDAVWLTLDAEPAVNGDQAGRAAQAASESIRAALSASLAVD